VTGQIVDEPLQQIGDDANSVIAKLFEHLFVIGGALEFNARQDLAELCLSSHTAPAVCVFRRMALTTRQVKSLFQVLNLPKSTADFFWITLNKIPAERHAVRVSLDHKLSIFFKVDVATDHIGTIAQGFGSTGSARLVTKYFRETGRTASGVAFELGANGSPRVRFYDNVEGFTGLADTQTLSDLVGENYLIELQRLSGDAMATPSVLNLCVTREGLSAKLEAPDVQLKPSDEDTADSKLGIFFRAVTRTMNQCGLRYLNYFGLRFKKTGHEVSCYLDATQAQARYANST